MHAELNAQLAFHLTGVRNAGELDAVEGLALRPALLAGYRDLAALRYDFPLVFTDKADAGFVVPLSRLVDEALQGADERSRHEALRREHEIRARLAGGAAGRLSEQWNLPLALGTDGELADCDASLPVRFLTRAWALVQQRKARRFHDEADALIARLAAILAADFVQSDEGRSAGHLAASLASREGSFDTEAMSRLLARALPERRLPMTRRLPIRSLLSVLKSQRFFAGGDPQGPEPFSFVFYGAASALKALRERRALLAELAKAVSAARLEAAGEYVEETHGPLFQGFAESALSPALAPDSLVCVNAGSLQVEESAALAELLASGLPVKILVQHDDILERSSVANAPAFGAHARLLAGMALGLNDVYVLQSSASNLYQMRERILHGLEYPGAALFSVFSGATGRADGLAPYLVAAAAMESRAFPAFSYDPAAGDERAARFSIEANPQPERDWPLHVLAYEDAEQQRVRAEVPFTLADFAACDERYGGYFARIPRGRPNGEAPHLAMVDRDDCLQKVIVAEPLMREARRCLDAWRGLQALARRAAPPAPAPSPAAEKPPAVPAPSAAVPEPEKTPAPDAPYIETARCTTCEECVKINKRMFVYDANKQAMLADAKAGTYRELVEAAEACQVSIIHPGKPLDPSEPGLDELLQRAEPFL